MSLQTEGDPKLFGLASFFLGVSYFGITMWSVTKLRRISDFMVGWTTQWMFYFFIVVHLCVRTLTWATFSFAYLSDMSTWYPYALVLQSLPETLFLVTYAILGMNWVEIYIFSHDQFAFPSRVFFQRRWRRILTIFVSIVFVLLGCFYALVAINLLGDPSHYVYVIETAQAVANFAFPFCFALTWIYFVCWGMSGFGYSSVVEEQRLSKLSRLVLFWTCGRVTRGFIALYSPQISSLKSNYVAMVVVADMVVTELLPFLFALDWSIISLLLLSDEPELRLRESATYQYRPLTDGPASPGGGPGSTVQGLDDVKRDTEKSFFIDPKRLTFSEERSEASASAGKFTVTRSAVYNPPPPSGAINADAGGRRKVFVKTFRFSGISAEMLETMVSDLRNYASLRSPRVASVMGVFIVRGCLSRVSEFSEAGSLRDVLTHCNRPLLADTILRVTNGICEGMAYLHHSSEHTEPVVHAHLKTTNILVDQDMNVKIADLGLRRIKSCMELISLQRSFTAFTAPEIFLGSSPGTKADVYAFGWICWEILAREPPLGECSIGFVKDLVVKRQERLPVPDHKQYPKDFADECITACWAQTPEDRPDFKTLRQAVQRMMQATDDITPEERKAVSRRQSAAAAVQDGVEQVGGGGVLTSTVNLVRGLVFGRRTSSADVASDAV